jgi:hypothetical protein
LVFIAGVEERIEVRGRLQVTGPLAMMSPERSAVSRDACASISPDDQCSSSQLPPP